MKVVKRRSMIVGSALAVALGLCAGGRLSAQEPVAPVAEVVEAAAPAAPVPVEAVVAPPAVAVEAPAPVPVEPAAPVVEAPAVVHPAGGEELPAGSADESGRITISLDGIELADVVQLFTRLSGANIICNTTNLKGLVTARLDNVEWEPAFRAILERQDLLLLEDPKNKGIFSIEPKKPDAPEPWVTETFKLSYLKAGEAAEMLKSMLGLADTDDKAKTAAKPKAGGEGKEDVAVVMRKEGRVVSYPAGNIIVVSTTAARMEEVRAVLHSVDLPRPQVFIEAKIVELTGEDAKRIGLDWSMLDGYEVGVSKILRDYQKTRSRERGGSDYEVSEAAAVYDYKGKRMSTESAPGSDMGLAAALNPVAIANSSTEYAGVDSATPGAAAVVGANDVSARFTSVSDISSAIFSAGALSLVMSAFQTVDNAAVISNPKVIVANEEKAVIDMSTKQPYVTVERTAGTEESPGDKFASKIAVIPGENEKLSYIEEAFFTFGLKLDVTPRINNASNITVVIEPTISTTSPYTTLNDAGEEIDTGYPMIHMKRVKTTFALGNGQTAVIGGLTTTRDRDTVKKVPLLGDIPLLGKYLFSHSTKEKVQVETIIFVTVGIVAPEDGRMALAVPEGATLVQGRVDSEGRLIKAPATMKPEKAALVPEVVEEK